MPPRSSSPVVPENEIDIASSLFQPDSPTNTDDEGEIQHPDRKARMQDGIPDLVEDDSDDAGFIADSLAAANRKALKSKGKTVKKGGGFQAMGLSANLLKNITRKGFSVPTPIQRKTIPMILDGQDVVGMARTGSGKTAAFVVPMIEKLKPTAKIGARALILSPSRELALQTLKVVKDLGRGMDLKCVLLVGGESIDEQFTSMTSNPAIIIATPGRFLHLKVEMRLDLSSIRYVVFDEADRLFEMGFAAQLAEVLHALPQTRQTLLFSATLPKSLVEFARAGLQQPNLVRLDGESKISPDLQSAFLTMKSTEKDGALLHILSDIIKIPTGQPQVAQEAEENAAKVGKKRKRGDANGVKRNESPTEHSTLIFAATKHRVEYLATLLRQFGYAVSHAYGSLDQTARKLQVEDFRTGRTEILIVTDVAARGIDIPILANVVNYDFPPQPKVFVHRVGRTARAGQRGWSFSLVQASEAPYLLDLQLFLGKQLVVSSDEVPEPNYANDVVVGSFVRDRLESNCEWVSKLIDEDADLQALRSVAAKGDKLYLRTRNAASTESVRRAKELVSSKSWMGLNPLFSQDTDDAETERTKMLARISGFRPTETVFEIGRKGQGGEAAEVMRKRRLTIDTQRSKRVHNREMDNDSVSEVETTHPLPKLISAQKHDEPPDSAIDVDMESASESELQITFPGNDADANGITKHPTDSFKSSDFFMSYTPTAINLAEDRGYGVHSGSYNTQSNFLSAARGATMDLTTDDGGRVAGGGGGGGIGEPSRMRWDKKAKKYVSRANDEDGSRKEGTRFIRGESGQKIAASFRSGRFEAWKKSNRIGKLPRVGDVAAEASASMGKGANGMGKRYRHRSDKAPKEADRYRDDFHKKRKLVEKAKEERRGRFRDGVDLKGGKGEVKGVEAVRKERGAKEKKREKSGRGRKGKRGGKA